MECSCCGRGRETVALISRAEVQLCRECVDALSQRSGVTSTPTLPVADLTAAVDFYERAGFGVRIYREADADPGAGDPGEGFAFVDFDGRSVFDLGVEPIDPSLNRAGCYLMVEDADEWHARLSRAGLPVTSVSDQPHGMREFTLTDPSGNRVRIGRSIA